MSAGTPAAQTGTPHASANVGTPGQVAGTPRFEGVGTGVIGGLGSSPMTAGRSVTGTGSEVGVGTPAFSMMGLGLGMGTDMKALGLGSSHLHTNGLVGSQDGEEERQRRLAVMVDLLGKRWGKAGREGVERCATRLGLQCLWDGDEKQGKSILSIAGNGLLVDVEWADERVERVVLSFPGAGEGAEQSAHVGAEVLKMDLLGDGTGYVDLKAFAGSLGRLAGMDVLGREGVSCFEAVEGLKVSLEKVFDWECGKVREEKGQEVDDATVRREVMCNRSGQPTMHGGGKIGLRFDYWMDRRLITSRKRKAEEMELDTPPNEAEDENTSSLHSLFIDCEACPASVYPPIRISDSWVSDTVEKKISLHDSLFTTDTSPADPIDWQDPPPTFRPNTDTSNPDAMTIDSTIQIQPNIRFVAYVSPPVIIPLQKAIDLYSLVGVPLTEDSVQFTTYMDLLLPTPSHPSEPLLHNRSYTFTRHIRTFPSSSEECREYKHHYSLLTSQQDYARTITEIPFSHPRQLVMILPLLRQYSFLATILRRTLGLDSSPPIAPVLKAPELQLKRRLAPTARRKVDRTRRPLTPPSDTDSDDDDEWDAKPTVPIRKIDVSLSLSQQDIPALSVVVPASKGQGEKRLTFYVGPGGQVIAEDEDEGQGEGGDGKSVVERAGRCLGVGEDLGVLVEWLMGR
jgi:hypothetical protein